MTSSLHDWPQLAVADRPEVNYTLCSVTASLVDSSVYVFGGKSTGSGDSSATGGSVTLPSHPYRLTDALFKLDLNELLMRRFAANAHDGVDHHQLRWQLLNPTAGVGQSPPWPSPRSVHGSAYWPTTDEILIHGGFGLVDPPASSVANQTSPGSRSPRATGTSDLNEAQLLGDLWAFNPAKCIWRKLNVKTDALSDHTITVDVRRNLLMAIGGASSVAGDLILPSLITAIDLHAHEHDSATESATATESVAQVYLQHYPKAFRRRRHTAAYTSEGVLIVGGRDERFVTQPPLVLKVSQVIQAKARHLNHAGGRGITISANEAASFDALLHQLAPEQLGTQNARTYANHSTAGFPRIVQLPAPHSAVLVLSFPTQDGCQWTHATVFDMASGAVVPGIEPVKLAGGPHFALAFNQAIVFLNHRFDGVTVVPYSRFMYFPTDLVAHLDSPMPVGSATETPTSLANDLATKLTLTPTSPPHGTSSALPWLPSEAHIECSDETRMATCARITVYPPLLAHIPHLQSAFDSRTASTESSQRLVRVPEPLHIVQAVLEYGYSKQLRVGPNDWPTVAGVYRLAHMWCVYGLQVACCKWVLTRVESQGPRLAFRPVDSPRQDKETANEGEEEPEGDAPITELWDEAHLVGDTTMVHVLEHAFRVWGVEWDST